MTTFLSFSFPKEKKGKRRTFHQRNLMWIVESSFLVTLKMTFWSHFLFVSQRDHFWRSFSGRGTFSGSPLFIFFFFLFLSRGKEKCEEGLEKDKQNHKRKNKKRKRYSFLDRKKTKRGKKTQDILRQKEESSMWWLLDGRRKKRDSFLFFFEYQPKTQHWFKDSFLFVVLACFPSSHKCFGLLCFLSFLLAVCIA